MSLFKIFEELIVTIWKIIDCDKCSCALFETCKDFRQIGIKYGWMRTIKLNRNSLIKDFLNFYTRYDISINNLTIEGLDCEPWIEYITFPKKIIFERSRLGNKLLNLSTKQVTETLVIRDLTTESAYVNWEMLPKLKVLDVYGPDINFDGLENCKDLEIIRIDLCKVKELPKFFENFSKLCLIATTCVANEPFHFVSKDLKCCSVIKKHTFTSNSFFVPKSHLEIGFKMNIQSIQI